MLFDWSSTLGIGHWNCHGPHVPVLEHFSLFLDAAHAGKRCVRSELVVGRSHQLTGLTRLMLGHRFQLMGISANNVCWEGMRHTKDRVHPLRVSVRS